jgi:osmotically-inducible protein OsmY
MNLFDQWTFERLAKKNKSSSLNRGLMLLGALGIGAGAVYLLDPVHGRRRRGLLRDKALHYQRELSHSVDRNARDLRNRVQGLLAERKSQRLNEPVSDLTLIERVRARMGRATRHPHAINVSADNGYITLSGPIDSREAKGLLSLVRKIPGVRDVRNHLDLRSEHDDRALA